MLSIMCFFEATRVLVLYGGMLPGNGTSNGTLSRVKGARRLRAIGWFRPVRAHKRDNNLSSFWLKIHIAV